MPWLTLIMFIISFVTSKASGRSTGEALLTGTLAAGATYLLADPANPDNLFGVGVNTEGTAGADATPVVIPPAQTGSSSSNGIGSAFGKVVDATGQVISDLGPTGLIAGGALVSGLTGNKALMWFLGGLAVVLLASQRKS